MTVNEVKSAWTCWSVQWIWSLKWNLIRRSALFTIQLSSMNEKFGSEPLLQPTRAWTHCKPPSSDHHAHRSECRAIFLYYLSLLPVLKACSVQQWLIIGFAANADSLRISIILTSRLFLSGLQPDKANRPAASAAGYWGDSFNVRMRPRLP
jgi:hypothetical protein